MANYTPNVLTNNTDNENICNMNQETNNSATPYANTLSRTMWNNNNGNRMKRTLEALSSRGTSGAEVIPPPEPVDNPRRSVDSLVSGTHKRYPPRSPGLFLPFPKGSRGPVCADVTASPELTDNPRRPRDGRRGTDKGARTYSPGWIGNTKLGMPAAANIKNTEKHAEIPNRKHNDSVTSPTTVTKHEVQLERNTARLALPSSALTNAEEYDRLQQCTYGPNWSNVPSHSTKGHTIAPQRFSAVTTNSLRRLIDPFHQREHQRRSLSNGI